MRDLNRLGGFNLYTEGGRLAPGYPIRVDAIIAVTRLAFPEPPSNLVSSVCKFYEGSYIPTDVLKSVMPV